MQETQSQRDWAMPPITSNPFLGGEWSHGPQLGSLTAPVRVSPLINVFKLFSCHRLATSNHLLIIICFGQQPRNSSVSMRKTSPKHLNLFAFRLKPRTQHLMPNLWVTRKICLSYATAVKRTTVFRHQKLLSAEMFLKPVSGPTLMLSALGRQSNVASTSPMLDWSSICARTVYPV